MQNNLGFTSNSKWLLHYCSTERDPVDLPAFVFVPATNNEASLQHVLPNKDIQSLVNNPSNQNKEHPYTNTLDMQLC